MPSTSETATVALNCARSTFEAIDLLKLKENMSIINFVEVNQNRGDRVIKDNAKVVDSLVDLLNTNHNIKSLNCKVDLKSTASLLEALAAGKAGYNLEALQEGRHYLGDTGATVLRSYLTKNQNLKRLGVAFYDCSAAMQLVSCLPCSSVVELELEVDDTYDGTLRELGTKLGKCNSIVSLQICFDSLYDQPDAIKSFFKEGLANMRCLTSLDIRLFIHASSQAILAPCEDGFLEMIKSSSFIKKADLTRNVGVKGPFRDEVESCCILNRVFGTNLIGFEPTALWTRVLAKIRNDSARATFLFRLLRDKPELLL